MRSTGSITTAVSASTFCVTLLGVATDVLLGASKNSGIDVDEVLV